MEISWYHFLADTDLRCFEERRAMRYSLRNRRTGQIYLLNAENAERVAALKADPNALRRYSEDELKETIGFLEIMRNAARAEATQDKAFNPLFIRWSGIDLAPHNARLSRLSAWLTPLVWPVTLVLLGLVLWFGTISEWQILSSAQAALSLEGLALFALVSPFLKIPHELGHALVARRYGVPLYRAGIVFVGLFPLPFVDASQADIHAARTERIRISLAGIFVDVIIAMLAFIAWHLVEGAMWKTLTASIFTLSSLNSILFNGNPFIRLDGYYAFADWIGQRNLSTTSGQIVSAWRKWLTSFGRAGARPARSDMGYLAYGLGSTFYKINILLTIVWITLPRFFGLGVLVGLWGAYALFVSPMFRSKPSPQNEEGTGMRKTMFRTAAALAFVALMFVPLPVFVVRTAALDTNNSYLIQSEERGYLRHLSEDGARIAEQTVFRLDNMILDQDIRNVAGEIEVLDLLRASVEQSDPFQTRVTEMQRMGAVQRYETLKARAAKLEQSVAGPGRFFAAPDIRPGSYVTEARNLGYFLPDADHAILVAEFPQWRLRTLKESTPALSVLASRDALAVEDFRIVQSPGQEQFRLLVRVPTAPQSLHGQNLSLKVHMGYQPVYAHIRDLHDMLLRNYRLSRNAQG